MKKGVVVLIVVLAVVISVASVVNLVMFKEVHFEDYVGLSPAENSLVAHYEFDRRGVYNGSNRVMNSAGKPHASLYEAFDFIEGISGKALSLDGSGYVVIDNTRYWNFNEFTMSAWIKKDENIGNWDRIMGKYRYKWFGQSGWAMDVARAKNNRTRCYVEGPKGDIVKYLPENFVPKGKWTHLACTFDGNELKMYVNGKESGKPVIAKESFIFPENDYPIKIGDTGKLGEKQNPFNGDIDEVKIYNYALSKEKINCNLAPKSFGSCKRLWRGAYFNSETQSCEEFAEGGCEAVVPFDSLEECEESCVVGNIEVVEVDSCGVIRGNYLDLDNKVNIVFVPSGYEGDMVSFKEDAENLWQNFEGHEIFDSSIDKLNVFFSTKEVGTGIKSYCVFGPFGSHSSFLFCDPIKARISSDICYEGIRETVVIHNSEDYGGAGLFWPINLHVATVSLHDAAYIVAVHELAHTLFEFGDEYSHSKNYYSSPSSSPNCDFEGCPKWEDLIGEFEDVSCLPGFCADGEYYIANENSIMANSEMGFRFGSSNERIACCTYKERTGEYPSSLCNKFQNNDNLINLDEFCSSSAIKTIDSSLKSLESDQQFWEYPLNDGSFSTEIIN